MIWRPLRGTQTVLTRRPGRGGWGYVSTRCPGGGARTVMPRRTQRGKGSAMTRRPLVPGVGPVVVRRWRHGAQTVLTRRPGRGGWGYVSTRCPGGGARTVMPRRTQRGKGSAMTRRPLVPGVGPVVVRRWRHGAQTCASLPGGARCSRIVLHLPIPVRGTYQRGVGTTALGVGNDPANPRLGGYATTPLGPPAQRGDGRTYPSLKKRGMRGAWGRRLAGPHPPAPSPPCGEGE